MTVKNDLIFHFYLKLKHRNTAVNFLVYAVSDQMQGSVSSLLQILPRDEDMSWAKREQQALGRVPSRGERGNRTL